MDEEPNRLIDDTLPPLTTEPRTWNLLAFDIETTTDDNGIPAFLCGAVCGDGIAEHFWDKQAMRDYLMSRRFRHHRIMATSLDFDFLALFGDVIERYKSDMVFRGSGLISVMVKDKQDSKGARRFLDTMNYYPVSVNELGRCIGLKKLDRPRCWLRQPKDDAERAEMREYNLMDARITYEWSKWFQDKLSSIRCEMKNTIASTSLWNWRRHYQHEALYQPSRHIMEEQLKAYYGGRTECFYRGTSNRRNYLYDINSAYGWSMTLPFPVTSSLVECRNPTFDDIMDYDGVMQADVACPADTFYPLLPYRDAEKKLLFPVGRWRGQWYTCVELRKAAELGYRIEPRRGWLYTENYFPFAVLQKSYYELRRENPDMSLIYKLLGNSLYGKFAQRWEDVIEYKHISDMPTLPDKFMDIIGEFVLIKKHQKPAVFVNPIISIYTAAYTRLRLFAYLCKLDGVYCDTDSIISERKIELSSELGELKLERSIRKLMLVRPKVYFYDDDITGLKVKAKGFRINTKEHFDFLLENGYLPQMRLMKFKESVRRRNVPLRQLNFNKQMKLDDTKREWSQAFDAGCWEMSLPRRIGMTRE